MPMLFSPFSVSSGYPGIPHVGLSTPVVGLAQRFDARKAGLPGLDIVKGAVKPAQRALTMAQPWKVGAKLTHTGISVAQKPVQAVESIAKKLKFW